MFFKKQKKIIGSEAAFLEVENEIYFVVVSVVYLSPLSFCQYINIFLMSDI